MTKPRHGAPERRRRLPLAHRNPEGETGGRGNGETGSRRRASLWMCPLFS